MGRPRISRSQNMYRILIFAGIFSLLTIAGCSSLTEKVILDGAVAAHSDNRIHVAGRQPVGRAAGSVVEHAVDAALPAEDAARRAAGREQAVVAAIVEEDPAEHGGLGAGGLAVLAHQRVGAAGAGEQGGDQ